MDSPIRGPADRSRRRTRVHLSSPERTMLAAIEQHLAEDDPGFLAMMIQLWTLEASGRPTPLSTSAAVAAARPLTEAAAQGQDPPSKVVPSPRRLRRSALVVLGSALVVVLVLIAAILIFRQISRPDFGLAGMDGAFAANPSAASLASAVPTRID